MAFSSQLFFLILNEKTAFEALLMTDDDVNDNFLNVKFLCCGHFDRLKLKHFSFCTVDLALNDVS